MEVSHWLIVVGTTDALDWIATSKTMAFRDHIPADRISKGDRFALYGTRGAGRNPGRDCGQVLATGTFTSGLVTTRLELFGETYSQSFRLGFDEPPLRYRYGAAFTDLLPALPFIKKPTTWFAYVRKSLVAIGPEDFKVIDGAVRQARKRNAPLRPLADDRDSASTQPGR